jgi:hypothetical protein
VRSAAVVAAAVAMLAACSSDGPPSGGDGQPATDVSSNPAVVADSNLPDPAEYATTGSIAEDPGFVQVDANTATTEQLIAAFQTNGIVDPATWAAQVIGHRPYTIVDQSGREFDALRGALAAAGLDDLAAGAIVASLTVTR